MISVQTLYQECQDMLRTYQGGYLSNDEFNRAVNQAQSHLFTFLLEDSNVDRYTETALDPFKVETLITKSSGVYQAPADFAALREIAVAWVLPSGLTEYRPAYPIENLGLTMTSPIRKPTTKTFGYVWKSNWTLYPDKNVQILLRYFKKPTTAERKVTYSGDDETYTATGTVDLEWNETEKSIILDMTLYYAGIISSMPDIVNWVQNKNSFIPIKNRDYKR